MWSLIYALYFVYIQLFSLSVMSMSTLSIYFPVVSQLINHIINVLYKITCCHFVTYRKFATVV